MLYATDAFGRKATVNEDLVVIGEEELKVQIEVVILQGEFRKRHDAGPLESLGAILQEDGIEVEFDSEDRDMEPESHDEGVVF